MSKRDVRFFNTTGPCDPDDHYMLPPEERLVGAQLKRYIGDKLYWVLHAPRQTGKTTFLLSWLREINEAGSSGDGTGAIACYVTVETCQGVPEAERAIPAICDEIRRMSKIWNLPVPRIDDESPQSQLNSILSKWAELLGYPRPYSGSPQTDDRGAGNAFGRLGVSIGKSADTQCYGNPYDRRARSPYGAGRSVPALPGFGTGDH
ncbi:MAG: hypothetical protein LBN21_01830 [Treponema sp.]|nr:hypothetical protein [Treponema sp.]